VAEIQIRFRAIVGDVHLTVLVRAHRPRIDVDVGIELLKGDSISVIFEEPADRRGGEPLAE
jgi:hypothetical protein